MTYMNHGGEDSAYIGNINDEKICTETLWNLRDALNIINTGEKSYSNEFGKVLSSTCVSSKYVRVLA